MHERVKAEDEICGSLRDAGQTQPVVGSEYRMVNVVKSGTTSLDAFGREIKANVRAAKWQQELRPTAKSGCNFDDLAGW